MVNYSKLEELYYNPDTGFTGVHKLYQVAKRFGYTYKQVGDFVRSQHTAQVNKLYTKPKLYYPIIGKPGGSYQMDIMFLNQWARQNNGFTAILVIINVTSKKTFVYPLKNKTETEVAANLVKFLREIDYKIVELGSDNGTEFLNRSVQKILKDNHIVHILAHPKQHTKQGIVERMIRTIRQYLERYFAAVHTVRWIDVIHRLIKNYNNAYHSAIKMIPNKVDRVADYNIRLKLTNKHIRVRHLYDNFKIGDVVRVYVLKVSLIKVLLLVGLIFCILFLRPMVWVIM